MSSSNIINYFKANILPTVKYRYGRDDILFGARKEWAKYLEQLHNDGSISEDKKKNLLSVDLEIFNEYGV